MKIGSVDEISPLVYQRREKKSPTELKKAKNERKPKCED